MKDIKELPVQNITDDKCVLFLWATTPMIQEAFEVMREWGFKYKTMITWEKTNKDCMGYCFRVCTEHLLVGVKGNVKSFRSMERTLHSEPRLGHSKKPQYFRDLINSVTEGKKIELFARNNKNKNLFKENSLDGWDIWGNEVESDIELN